MNMVRLHRSLAGRLKSIDPSKIADSAEDYLESLSNYRRLVQDIRGLVPAKRLKGMIRKIDGLEKDIMRLEDKITRLSEKRAEVAVRLEEDLRYNLEVLGEFLDAGEMRDFQ
ncbi:hypothetical protein HY605_02635 [Candidatus Peregrinibacteria bacterium]|nr:hypothetical protein [Candidatus Peregrinibacteria bacterium]